MSENAAGGEGVSWVGGVEFQEFKNRIAQRKLREGMIGGVRLTGWHDMVVAIAVSYMTQRERSTLVQMIRHYL